MGNLAAKVAADGGSQGLQRAQELLEQEKLDEAIAELEQLSDTNGAAAAMLGAAYFRKEDYARAAVELQKAMAARPNDKLIRGLAERAAANDQADVRRQVPTPIIMTKQSLPTAPQPGAHGPSGQVPLPPASLMSRLLHVIGDVSGKKLGEALYAATQLLGREGPSRSPWTSWYQHEVIRATIMLAYRRHRLNRDQLFAAYPKQEGTGFFRNRGSVPSWVKTARSADGSWNDLNEPMAGAANMRFGFNTHPSKTQAETGARLLSPNPRMVSRVLLTRKDGTLKPVPFLNLNAASWIQFMNHDWVSYGDPMLNAPPYRIPLEPDDPARKALHQTHMLVRPTQTDPTRREGEPTTHINEVTSWWDGSQIYGSDEKTIHSLRSKERGKLKIDPQTGTLPILPDGVEAVGFRRNWWLGLSMLHTLFVREHNSICDMLAARYPKFSDERLFDTARLINAAVMAKIHTVEWTPAILPNEALNSAMNANWYGLLTNALRSKRERRTLAEINVADPIAGGLVGNATDNHGVPYSLTREFLSVYRLHSLLPDRIDLFRIGGTDQPVKSYALAELRQAASHKVTQAEPMFDLFYSFGRQNPGQLVLNNYPDTLQNLSIPGAGFYDLGAVDVLRDRERGVPRYNQFRRLMGMRPLARIEELSDDPNAIRALKQVYTDIEDVDLLIGNLAEAHRPTAFGFGETLFEIFILNASRRLQADRFFTESYREEVYTAEGLGWVDDASLKSVLLRQYPQLASTGLMNVENGFEPWDLGSLDPSRHPLRQFDRHLREADENAKRYA
jgi:Animal haem peroxidase